MKEQQQANLKHALIDKRLSCLELSRMADVSPSQLSMVLNGWRRPSDALRQRLLEIFPDVELA